MFISGVALTAVVAAISVARGEISVGPFDLLIIGVVIGFGAKGLRSVEPTEKKT